MRILKLHIDDFRNLKDFDIDFAASAPDADGHSKTFHSYAVIGQNGSGKSNLLEAIITIFRDLDLGSGEKEYANFAYTITYEIRGKTVEVQSEKGRLPNSVTVDGKKSSLTALRKEENGLLPKNVFAYYSGKNDRIESLFHRHQKKFYDDLLSGEDIPLRRLFLCRDVHSQFVLMAYLIEDDAQVRNVLSDLGISDLESVLFALKRPYWYGSNPSEELLTKGDQRFWFARGKVQSFLDKLWQYATAPIEFDESRTIDFRDRKEKLELRYLFLKDEQSLKDLAQSFAQDSQTEPTAVTFFKYLESTYISDLIDKVSIKMKHENSQGEISFREMSEGEQQLLTVLGLMRLTKEDESLFLLDEPDTHLNPVWKLRYFDDIQKVIGESSSQILLTTHDPIMIGSLRKEQVRILRKELGTTLVSEPDEHPQGMGVSGLLKSELFGLQSTVDTETMRRLHKRNALYAKGDQRTQAETAEMMRLSKELSELGFASDFKDPYFEMFVKKMALHTEFHQGTLTPEEQAKQEQIAGEIIAEVLQERPL